MNNKTCSQRVEDPAPKNRDKASAPVSLNLANLSLTQLLNRARGSCVSKASNISITGVARVANLRLINIKAKAIVVVAPTSPSRVNSIFTHTSLRFTESNQR